MMVPLQANQMVTITLEAQQWQVVVGALHETPYRLSHAIIESLNQQFSVLVDQKPNDLKTTLNGSAEIPPVR